jgi:alpha/beta superfamily hydrolase
LPVIVIPDADHFFHRRLGVLKALVARNLLGSERMLPGRARALGGAVAGID